MPDEPAHWYPSKVDWWVVPLLCLPPIGSVAATVALAMDGKVGKMLIGVASMALLAAIYFGLVFPMHYGISDTHLVVRFGMVRQRIPLTDITEVYPTHNPLSSPALSLDRLHVRVGQSFFKSVMISPDDRDQFLDELASGTGLTRDDDQLVLYNQPVAR
jgi:hypothetical protein